MRYDFGLIAEMCAATGLLCIERAPDEMAIVFHDGIALLFQNAELDKDCLMTFEGGEWHTHDGLIFSDRHGYHVEFDYLDIVTGLANETVLICELWVRGVFKDRWLVHRDYVDEFRHLAPGDEIRIRPAQAGRN